MTPKNASLPGNAKLESSDWKRIFSCRWSSKYQAVLARVKKANGRPVAFETLRRVADRASDDGNGFFAYQYVNLTLRQAGQSYVLRSLGTDRGGGPFQMQRKT